MEILTKTKDLAATSSQAAVQAAGWVFNTAAEAANLVLVTAGRGVYAVLKAACWTAKLAVWPAVQVARVGLGGVMVVREYVPYSHYVIDSFALVMTTHLVVVPAITVSTALVFGLAYAAWATAVSIPTYLYLLCSSFAPWPPIAFATLALAGLWVAADLAGWAWPVPIAGNISELEHVRV
jgi:hypothetical protein